MGLYEQWRERADALTTEAAANQYWSAYFEAETENYRKILSSGTTLYTGTVKELAESFHMDPVVFSGFIDGINTSLKDEVNLEELTEESAITLDIDLEKLYYNMLAAKAPWLYGLSEWDARLSAERRHEITKEFRSSQIFVREKKIGRNDPCPCGSGKKYKKCCGKNA